jgi:hypothetical protein
MVAPTTASISVLILLLLPGVPVNKYARVLILVL